MADKKKKTPKAKYETKPPTRRERITDTSVGGITNIVFIPKKK